MSLNLDRDALASRLEQIINTEIDKDTKLSVSHEEWRIIISALKENAYLISFIEMVHGMAASPIVNPLEVGFRHSPYTDKEITDRLKETCSFIAQDCLATLKGIG